MKKPLTITIRLNNLLYMFIGHAYYEVMQDEQKIIDEGMIITECKYEK